MRRYVIPLLFFALFPCTAAAELRFVEPIVDLGTIRAGRRLTHQVRFTNIGSTIVRILDVRGSCGCLHPTVSEKTLEPGQSASVAMTINPFGQPAGKHRWRAFVQYQVDGQIRQATLEASATLITDVTIQPSRLTLYPTNTVRQTLTFIDLRAKPLTINRVEVSCPWLTVGNATPMKQANGKWTAAILLENNKPIPAGKHHLNIVISTNDPYYRELYVPISVVKREQSRLQAIPSQVVLQASSDALIASQLVRIRRRDGKMVKIVKISCDNPAIRCRWANGPGRFTTVRIEADRGQFSQKKFTCKVHVQTAEPVDEILTLTVICDFETNNSQTEKERK